MAQKCPYCGRTFKTKKGLHIHIAKVHKRKKNAKTRRRRKRGGGAKKLDTLGKVMSKVARGMKLNKREREILSAAIDASKKAKSEKR